MMVNNSDASHLIGRVATELTHLPAEDLPLVIEFVEYLKQQHQSDSLPLHSATQIRAEARRRSRLLGEVPREEVVARFQELVEEIRLEALTHDEALEGDWQGD